MESTQSVFEKIKDYRDEFGSLLKAAMKDGIAKLAERVSQKKYIGTYYKWPKISYRENGLPCFSSSSFQEVKEYRRSFGLQNDDIIISDIKSFKDFFNFVTSDEHLEGRFINQWWRETKINELVNVRNVFINYVILDAIERYIHINNSFEYDADKAVEVVEEILNFIFSETLPIDIIIPILFVNFESDLYSLSDKTEVRVLTEKEHLARYSINSYNVSVHDAVLASATHALVLRDWKIKNSACTHDFNALYSIRAYPIDRINKFFASLRLGKNIRTGYAQVFSLAKSWFSKCKGDLPDLIGTTTRSYPGSFEDYYWDAKSVPLISNSEMETVGRLFDLLIESEENSIDLSVRRLNQCYVRDNEEDSVLDATIALEALLSDDGNQEMIHKLAMRVGGLVGLDNSIGKLPYQAFKDIKSIYAYRSAIVHGSKSIDKRRIVKIDENQEGTTHSLAVEYLRFILKILIENPKYRDPKIIDSELLLGGAKG